MSEMVPATAILPDDTSLASDRVKANVMPHSPGKPRAIDNTPVEILAHIFILSRTMNYRAGIPLAGVCRFWRAISFSTPSLWDIIHFRLDRSFDDDRQRRSWPDLIVLNISLKLSANLPVSVYIRNRPDRHLPYSLLEKSIMRQIANVLTPHMSRVKVLEAVTWHPFSINQLIEHLPQDAPLLESMRLIANLRAMSSLANGGTHPNIFDRGTRVGARLQAPKLTELTISACTIHRPTIADWSSIRHLTILQYSFGPSAFRDPSLFFHNLRQLPNLTRLRLEGAGTSAGVHLDFWRRHLTHPNRPYKYPRLEHLTLDNISADTAQLFLRRLKAPLLETINLENAPFQVQWYRVFATLSNTRNFPKLATFALNGICPALLPHLLGHMPYCQTLRVRDLQKCCCDGCLNDPPGNAVELLLAVDSEGMWRCPDLKLLVISGENPPEWTIGLPGSCMKELIQNRKQASMVPTKFEEPRPPVAIMCMIYAGFEEISPEDVQWFQQNLREFDTELCNIRQGA